MRWVLLIILLVLPGMTLAEALPKAVAKAVGTNPDKYIDDLSVLIDGFGTDGAIDRRGLQNVVALARAEARAMALRRLLGADLDGDGAIAGAELRLTAAAESAAARGRLKLYFGKADRDADDLVSAKELLAYANDVALKALSEDKALTIFAILGFDGNGDGRVTVAEAKVAISALAAEQGDPRKIQNQFDIQGKGRQGERPADQIQPPWRGKGSQLAAAGREQDRGRMGEAGGL